MTKAGEIFKHLNFQEIQEYDKLKAWMVDSFVQAMIADIEKVEEAEDIDEASLLDFSDFVTRMYNKYKDAKHV